MTESRGGIDLSLAGLAERSAEYIDRLEWMIAGPWGGSLTRESFQVGLATLLASGFGLVLAAATEAALTLTALVWRPRRGGRNETDRAPWPCGAWMLLAGAVGFAATLLFRGTLLRGQLLEFRMLYVPRAAGCLFVGVCVGALALRAKVPQLEAVGGGGRQVGDIVAAGWSPDGSIGDVLRLFGVGILMPEPDHLPPPPPKGHRIGDAMRVESTQRRRVG